LAAGQVTLRDLASGQQETIARGEMLGTLQRWLAGRARGS